MIVPRGRLGRVLAGMAELPVALATSGTSINLTRVLVFCLSAYLAAIAGALIGASLQSFCERAQSFDPFVSLTFLAVTTIITGGEPWNAGAIAAAGLGLVPAYVSSGDHHHIPAVHLRRGRRAGRPGSPRRGCSP